MVVQCCASITDGGTTKILGQRLDVCGDARDRASRSSSIVTITFLNLAELSVSF